MTTIDTESTRDEIIARNLAAVDVHFHNETPDSIDAAVSVYTDDIVWEVPARGLLLKDVDQVKQEYLKIFGAMTIHKITNLHRFATEEWVFDDSIFEWTITGRRVPQLPVPARHAVQRATAARLQDAGRQDRARARLRDLASGRRPGRDQRRHPRRCGGDSLRLKVAGAEAPPWCPAQRLGTEDIVQPGGTIQASLRFFRSTSAASSSLCTKC